VKCAGKYFGLQSLVAELLLEEDLAAESSSKLEVTSTLSEFWQSPMGQTPLLATKDPATGSKCEARRSQRMPSNPAGIIIACVSSEKCHVVSASSCAND
jgi:hypothetical protein